MARSFEKSLLYLLHLILAMWQRRAEEKEKQVKERGRALLYRQTEAGRARKRDSLGKLGRLNDWR
jgi:hypothetical protein